MGSLVELPRRDYRKAIAEVRAERRRLARERDKDAPRFTDLRRARRLAAKQARKANR